MMFYPFDNTKVTIELRELVSNGVDVWAFDYPSYYKGDDKKAFEQKVLDHYWLRQIGQETPGRWLHYFRSRIREIMPYYIQLYESQALMQSIEDPFGNVDVTETFEQTSTGERSGSLNRSTSGSLDSTTTGSSDVTTTDTENNTGSSTKKFSNTPQGSIDNLDSYLTEATIESANNEKTGNGTSSATNLGSQKDTSTGTQNDTTQDSETGTIRHTLTKKGNQGVNTYAHDMKELRETFLNIDLMIINELKDLFLMVY